MQVSTASRKQDVFSRCRPVPLPTIHRKTTSALSGRAGRTRRGGLFFSPLPGFHFSACGPLRRDVPFRKELLCDVPVIVAILFPGR